MGGGAWGEGVGIGCSVDGVGEGYYDDILTFLLLPFQLNNNSIKLKNNNRSIDRYLNLG